MRFLIGFIFLTSVNLYSANFQVNYLGMDEIGQYRTGSGIIIPLNEETMNALNEVDTSEGKQSICLKGSYSTAHIKHNFFLSKGSAVNALKVINCESLAESKESIIQLN